MDEQLLEKNPIDGIILGIIREQKPQTTEQLIKIAREKTALSERDLAELIIRLENESKMQFSKKEAVTEADSEFVVFSKSTGWFWITVALAVTTVAVVFMVPEGLYPIIYLRQVLGLVFVLFLPGYTFVKMLFPFRMPFETGNEKMDRIERIALSLGASIALTPMVGLILYYTQFGLSLGPITLGLLLLTIVFGIVAVGQNFRQT